LGGGGGEGGRKPGEKGMGSIWLGYRGRQGRQGEGGRKPGEKGMGSMWDAGK